MSQATILEYNTNLQAGRNNSLNAFSNFEGIITPNDEKESSDDEITVLYPRMAAFEPSKNDLELAAKMKAYLEDHQNVSDSRLYNFMKLEPKTYDRIIRLLYNDGLLSIMHYKRDNERHYYLAFDTRGLKKGMYKFGSARRSSA